MGNDNLITKEDFFKSYGINNLELSYNSEIKILKNIIFQKKVDLDILEINLTKNSNNIDICQFMEKEQKINIEIGNLYNCINQVRLLRNHERKEKISQFVKKIVPLKRG